MLPKKGPGRPKGSVNKLTADIKEMILGALRAKGGQKYLERQADENPVAFMSLVGRTVPKEIEIDATIQQCDVTAQAMTAEEWTAQYAADNAALN